VRFVLDTDHISIIEKETEPEYTAISSRLALFSMADWSCSIVSFHEQVLGCNKYLSKPRNTDDVVEGYDRFIKVLALFRGVSVLPFDQSAAREFDRLRAQRVRVGTYDLRIASIALSRGLILLTRNTRDFAKVPGLVIEDWTV
jgi:tRNA(fMet)-specific endonuclease VapC